MTTRGGARPGAGRKGKDRFAGAIEDTENYIATRMQDLVRAMETLALGVTVQKRGRDGEVQVYTEPPSYKALEYLMNRVMGRPTEAKEVDAVDDAPKIIGYIVQTSQTPPETPSAE